MPNLDQIALSPELLGSVKAVAQWRGMSLEAYVSEAVQRAVGLDSALRGLVSEAEADIAAGRTYTQAEVEATFRVHREQRDAA